MPSAHFGLRPHRVLEYSFKLEMQIRASFIIDLKYHSNRQVYCCATHGHWSRVQRQYLDTIRMCPVNVRPYGSTSKQEYQLAEKDISVTKLSGSYLS